MSRNNSNDSYESGTDTRWPKDQYISPRGAKRMRNISIGIAAVGLASSVAAGSLVAANALKHQNPNIVAMAKGDLNDQKGVLVDGKLMLPTSLKDNQAALKDVETMQRQSLEAAVSIAGAVLSDYKDYRAGKLPDTVLAEDAGTVEVLTPDDPGYIPGDITIQDNLAGPATNILTASFQKNSDGNINLSGLDQVQVIYPGPSVGQATSLNVFRSQGSWAMNQIAASDQLMVSSTPSDVTNVTTLNAQATQVYDALHGYLPKSEQI